MFPLLFLTQTAIIGLCPPNMPEYDEKFFDTLDHAHLRAFLQQRVRDGVVLRLIGKWLNAGVLEAGAVTHPEAGSPQGGVISPLLANVYLHYVLDEWFAKEVQPRLRGRAYVVRYADDFVVGFTDDEDARRVMAVLPKRFGKYGLTIHPDKTRLVPFRKPEGERKPPKPGGPGTFDFLGFTHFWARSRKGNWVLKRKTAASRFTRAVRTLAQWCRQHRHDPIERTTRGTVPEAAGPRGVLRGHGQQPGTGPFPLRGAHGLAEVARAATAWRGALLGLVSPAPGTLPRALPAGDPLRCRSVANG